MNRISEIFLTVSEEEMYEEVLKVILEAMSSQYGIFGYLAGQNSVNHRAAICGGVRLCDNPRRLSENALSPQLFVVLEK